jgi:hypothetical protein
MKDPEMFRELERLRGVVNLLEIKVGNIEAARVQADRLCEKAQRELSEAKAELRHRDEVIIATETLLGEAKAEAGRMREQVRLANRALRDAYVSLTPLAAIGEAGDILAALAPPASQEPAAQAPHDYVQWGLGGRCLTCKAPRADPIHDPEPTAQPARSKCETCGDDPRVQSCYACETLQQPAALAGHAFVSNWGDKCDLARPLPESEHPRPAAQEPKP